MGFDHAIKLLKQGKKVYRKGWYNDEVCLEISRVQYIKYIGIHTKDDWFVPWTDKNYDVLAEDWEEFINQ